MMQRTNYAAVVHKTDYPTIKSRYLAGEKLSTLGADFGVIPERIRQILKTMDVEVVNHEAGPRRNEIRVPELTDPAPCDDCKLADLCADHLIACEAFHDYVQGNAWENGERQPGRDWMRAVFLHDKSAYRRAYYATKKRRDGVF